MVDITAEWLGRRFGRRPLFAQFLAVATTLAGVALPLTAGILFDRELARVDHRELAGRWVEENIAAGSKIAIEHYSIPFDYDRFHVEDVVRVSDHHLAWYKEEGFEVLIISDGVWNVLRQQPEYYADQLLIYDELLRGSELLAEFVRKPAGLVTAGYPTVEVFHFAPVRILRLAR
jgi:hypothetical protein